MARSGLTRRACRDILRLIRLELWPYAKRRFPRLKERPADWRARLSRGITLTAEDGRGKTIGFVHVIRQGPVMWLDMLAVDRGHRGRGVGSRLLRRAERYACRRGSGILKLMVDVENIGAIRFYGNHGFTPVAYHPGMACYEYAKPLETKKRLFAERNR